MAFQFLLLVFFSIPLLRAYALPTAPPYDPPSQSLQECAASMNDKLPSPTPSNFQFSGNVRKFYVAAEEVEWNYAPTGWDNWLGVPIDMSPRAKMSGYDQYGTTWLKGLYRGYTDSTFSKYSPQPPWQGVQGPTLRAEVGDLIEIMFVNKLLKNFATMHPMGLSYTKYDEGSDYPNNTAPGENVLLPEAEAVPPTYRPLGPGGCVVYKWMIDPTSGPQFGDPAVTHSYHSYVTLQQDEDAGLIGPLVVYAANQMEKTMAAYREFVLLYNIFSEPDSWLSGENRARLKGKHGKRSSIDRSSDSIDERSLLGNESVWKPQEINFHDSGQFPTAPAFDSMNGFIFGNNPKFEMCLNDQVIWYVNGYGSDSHVFHMHGNDFVYNGVYEYAESLNDGEGKTFYMNATDAGLWQVVCHVADHQTGGMESYYQVYYAGTCPLPALSS